MFGGRTIRSLLRPLPLLSRRSLSTGSSAVSSARSTLPALTVLRLPRVSIWEQLRLEEALLRADNRNWCIVNQSRRDANAMPFDYYSHHRIDAAGSERAIVLGLSGDANALINLKHARGDGVPLIRRFSGGGTVYVDHSTKFMTLIVNQPALPNVLCFPKPVMQWTAQLYAAAFGGGGGGGGGAGGGGFELSENDYTFAAGSGGGERERERRKFAGNAQCFTKQRWLHHTSVLWDFHPPLLHRYLTLPNRRPAYRADRTHSQFLTKLKAQPIFAGQTPTAAAAQAEAEAEVSLDEYLESSAAAPYDERFEDAIVNALRGWFDVNDPTAAVASDRADDSLLERRRADWVHEQTAAVKTAEHMKLTRQVTYDELDAELALKRKAAQL